MKREIFAALLLLALLALSVWNIHTVDSVAGQIGELLSFAEAECQNGSFERALDISNQALDIWLGADRYTHIFIRHSEIDSTSDAFYELLCALCEGELESAEYSFGKLRYHLDSLADMEHISLGSVM